LVRAGADVHRANHFGGTCLINSVQSPELVKFLIDVGRVNVNAMDVQNKTALHYAIQVRYFNDKENRKSHSRSTPRRTLDCD
jgi:ankyrin repeat protein